jgi:osmotically-inducible protein OsmY
MKKTLVALITSSAVLLSMAACSSTRTQRAPGEQVDDAALLTSVKSALVANKVTDAGEINVDVNRGTVKLAGFVDTEKEKAAAGEVARKVNGVQTVQNDIAVHKQNESTGDYIDDSVLTAKVKTALIESPKRRLTRSTSRLTTAWCSSQDSWTTQLPSRRPRTSRSPSRV